MLKDLMVKFAAVAFACCLSFMAHAMADSPKRVNIPAGDLVKGLESLARQADVEIVYRAAQLKGLHTRGAHGNFTPHDAVTKLLEGTNLRLSTDASTGAMFISSGEEGSSIALQSSPSGGGSTSNEAGKEGRESSSGGFRVAQATPGQAVGADTVDQQQSGTTGSEPGLQEVIVTAQKREERLQNVPISISVLSGQTLDKSTVLGATDALNTVPGVATQEDYLGGGTVVVIRGVAPAFPTIGGSSPVAYYLDSVPFGLVKSAIAPDSNVYDLARIEVLRGPQGTLYGASALNGVVRILTNDASLTTFDVKGRVSDSYTQYGGNNYRADGALNIPIIDGILGMRVVGGYARWSGWIDQPDKDDANWRAVTTYRVKVNAEPVNDLSVGLTAWGSRDHAGAPSVGYTFDKTASAVDQPVSTNYDAYSGTINYELAPVTISSATSYLTYANSGTLGLDVPPFNADPALFPPGSTFVAGENSHVFAEELNLKSSGLTSWRWSLGGMYRRATEIRTDSYPLTILPSGISHDTSESYAAYGELTRLFLDGRLEATAGLRHFHDNVDQLEQEGAGTPFIPASTKAEANTPRAIVTWHPSDRQMLYASYAEGFRSGFPQDASVPPNAGIPPVAPDRLRNYELGTKGSAANGRVTYDTSIYYMDWRGIQQSLAVYSTILQEYTTAIVNSNSASGIGVDLALSVRPIDSVLVQASVSWNNLEMDRDVFSNGEILFHKGDRPDSSPETTAGLSGQYSFALGHGGYGGRINASANYTSSQAYRGFGNTPAALVQEGDPMVLTRASFSVDFPSHWSVTLYGDNLNNERGSPVEAFIGTVTWNARVRPRTIGLQVDYSAR